MNSSSASPFALKTTKYSDFSKNANDFFSKEFPSGQIKVEARTLSKNLFIVPAGRPGALKSETFSDEFKITAVRDLTTGTIAAEVKNTSNFALVKSALECKSVSTLTSSNLLTQQLILSNPAIEGLKLDITGTLQPVGPVNTKVSIDLIQPAIMATVALDLFRGPIVNADVSTRFRDVQVGAEIGYDVAKSNIEKYTAAIAFDRPREKVVLQALTGFKSFAACYHQKFNDQLEVAYKATWNGKLPNLGMEIGAKYYLIGGGFLKAKLDNAGRLGLAFSTDLRPDVQLSIGATLDTTKMNENAHKFGLELNYSA